MERQGWGWKVRQGLSLVCVSPTRNTLEGGSSEKGEARTLLQARTGWIHRNACTRK